MRKFYFHYDGKSCIRIRTETSADPKHCLHLCTDIGSTMSRLPGTTGVPVPEIPVLFHQQLLGLQADLWLEHPSHKKTDCRFTCTMHGEN